MNGDILLTGATGLIGGEIAWRLMQEGRRVWCLVRRKSGQTPVARLEQRFALSGQRCDWRKLVALPGDVTHDHLGLDAGTLDTLRGECRSVIHCAADTSFATPNNCAEVNVTGTRHVVELCSQLGCQVRLFHCSSAYTRLKSSTGVIHEDDPTAGFANDYLQSKRTGEDLVLQAPLDAVVLRPSIVLSHGIQSPKLARSLLWVAPVMRSLEVLPLTGDEQIDAVSVRFVAEAVIRLLQRPLLQKVYHISAGPKASVTAKECFAAFTAAGLDYSQVAFDPALISKMPAQSSRRQKRLAQLLDCYCLVCGIEYIFLDRAEALGYNSRHGKS